MPVLTRRPVRKQADPRKELAREFLKGVGLTLTRTDHVSKLRAIEAGTLNYVAACGVLESCNDVLAAFQVMHRVLKPGGAMFLTVVDERDRPATPLGHLAADYVHGPDQPDGVRQHVWTLDGWMELLLAVTAGLGMDLVAVRSTRQEIITVLRKAP